MAGTGQYQPQQSNMSRKLERLFGIDKPRRKKIWKSDFTPSDQADPYPYSGSSKLSPPSFQDFDSDTLRPTSSQISQQNETPPIIPQSRWCGWKDFMNRFSIDEPTYAIDALIAGSQLGKEMATEYELRCTLLEETYSYDKYKPPTLRYGHSTQTWLQRIRINSPALLKVFDKVTDYSWGTKPHTFIRPFCYLIHFHDKIKDELQQMEAEYYENTYKSPGQHSMSSWSSGGSYGDRPSVASTHARSSSTIGSLVTKSALEDTRCYIDFAERSIIPLYNSFNHADYSNSRKIRFDDLWYLFRPGELIYVPTSSLKKAVEQYFYSDEHGISETIHATGPTNMAQTPASMHQKLWRLSHAAPPWSNPEAPLDSESNSRQFILYCYYLDFDGSSFAAAPCVFPINYFEGERDIRNLDYYPIRFAPNHEAYLQECRSSGLKYTECLVQKHMSYSGWTINTSPTGLLLPDPDIPGGRIARPENIDGDVIIDFKEAFNSAPVWKAEFIDDESWTDRAKFDVTTDGLDPIITWSDPSRSKYIKGLDEVIVTNDDIDAVEHDIAFEKDRYINHQLRSYQSPTGDDLALLPGRVFAYALRERRFVQLNVQHLKPIPYQADVFDKLELPESHKMVVDALVSSHLEKKRISSLGEISTQDIICGKGSGIVIMLHGEPGVGKTATAEAVAQRYGRPLFSISCGDLGVVPTNVEASLNEIFRLAHLWDCILLLDEADIFLTARSATDLKRNGIVTVFLRIMEYYNGVLFLTTNRIGKLDPAITSRIHVSLHYKRFGETELRNVFRLNIEQLKQVEEERFEASGEPRLHVVETDVLRFASEHYHRHENSKDTSAWNGRQIRNAFLTASALARRQAASHPSRHQPYLRACHFEEVEKLTADFDRLKAHLMGGNDSYLARKREERDDSWGEVEQPTPSGRSRLSMMLSNSPNDRTQANSYPTTPPQSLPRRPVATTSRESSTLSNTHQDTQFPVSMGNEPPTGLPQQNNPSYYPYERSPNYEARGFSGNTSSQLPSLGRRYNRSPNNFTQSDDIRPQEPRVDNSL